MVHVNKEHESISLASLEDYPMLYLVGNSTWSGNKFVSQVKMSDVDYYDVEELDELEKFGDLAKHYGLDFGCFHYLNWENFLSRSNIDHNNLVNCPYYRIWNFSNEKK